MRSIILLLKRDFIEFSSSFRYKDRKGDIFGAISTLILSAVIFGVFIYVFNAFAKMYVGIDFGVKADAYLRVKELLILACTAVFVVDVVVGVVSSYKAISDGKDINVLVYRPIDSGALFGYKLIKIYASQLLSSAITLLPVVIVADVISPYVGGVGYYFLAIFIMILIPLVSCAIASVLSVPYTGFMRLIEDKFVIKLVCYVILLGVGFWLYGEFLKVLTELLRTGEIRNFLDYKTIRTIQSVTDKLYPSKFFAEILLKEHVGRNIGILLAIGAVASTITFFVIRGIYNKMVQLKLEGVQRTFRKQYKFRARSVLATLIRKEFVTVLRTPTYAFQYFATTVTLPFMVYVCVMLLRSLMSTLTIFNCDLELAMFVISMFCIMTNTFCTTNISRDGRMYAMLKTMPISVKDYILAKLIFCGVVSVVSVTASVVALCAVGYLNAWQGAYVFFAGVILSMAEVAYATRKDMNSPSFPTGAEVAEGNNGTSTLILAGLLVSAIAGGGSVAVNAVLSLLADSKTAILSSLAVITVFVLGFAGFAAGYLIKGLEAKYRSGGENNG